MGNGTGCCPMLDRRAQFPYTDNAHIDSSIGFRIRHESKSNEHLAGNRTSMQCRCHQCQCTIRVAEMFYYASSACKNHSLCLFRLVCFLSASSSLRRHHRPLIRFARHFHPYRDYQFPYNSHPDTKSVFCFFSCCPDPGGWP